MNEALITQEQAAGIIAANTDDDRLIDLWLRKQRSPKTRESYGRTIADFRKFVEDRPIKQITLEDVLNFFEWVGRVHSEGVNKDTPPTVGTQARKLATVKSLLTFAFKTGYTKFNAGQAVSVPKVKNTLAERILSEEDIFKLFAAATNPRDELLLRTLYRSGARISEALAASWRDLQPRTEGGQITLFGKRDQTRAVLLPEKLWRDLMESRAGAPDDAPVFKSRKGRLGRKQAWRIVKKCAKKAGISWAASPHWLRHAHATHALDNGASLKLVSETLGHESLTMTGRYAHIRPGESSSTHLKLG